MSSSSSSSSSSSLSDFSSLSSSSSFFHGKILRCWQQGQTGYMTKDIRILHDNIIAVLEGRRDILSFDEDYQQRIKDYYKFSATFKNVTDWSIFLTKDTLDLI